MRISLVGAGGKTTLLFSIAERLSASGGPVAVTTTTKIRKPEAAQIRQWERSGGRIHVFGTPAAQGKLSAPPEETFRQIFRHYRHVVIEADGAKHFPLKVPAAHEPVIRPETELVICVAGMDALDRPLREACFRWELLPEELRQGDRRITEEDMAAVLAADWGGRKGSAGFPFRIFLNKCDTAEQRDRAGRILELLRKNSGLEGSAGCLKEGLWDTWIMNI